MAKFEEGNGHDGEGLGLQGPGCAQVLALQHAPASGAVLNLLTVSFARLIVIKEQPSIASSDPPELPPKLLRAPARAVELGHKLPPKYAVS
jgi:hypothetical protein